MTSLFVFLLSSENWMYFPEKEILSSNYFDLDCVFISNTRDDREQGIPRRHSRPGSSLQQTSTSFSDENCIMILFSEYSIVFCFQMSTYIDIYWTSKFRGFDTLSTCLCKKKEERQMDFYQRISHENL